MTDDGTGGGNEFVIPARTLRGSRQDMTADIDQAIVGLLALRHMISGEAPPARPVFRHESRRGGVFARLVGWRRAIRRSLASRRAARRPLEA